MTREELYDLVWSEPMLKVAARFNVSSSYLARVCTRLNVPRPERGYWAKLAVGKTSPKPALPEARPGDEILWVRAVEGGGNFMRPLPTPPTSKLKKDSLSQVIPLSKQHPLITGAKDFFEEGRLSHEGDYLIPAKKLILDLAVTKQGLDTALSFANQLFLTLENNGHRVVIAPQSEYFHRARVDEREGPSRYPNHYNNLWKPGRCTVVYIGTVAIGLTIIEMSEEVKVRYVNGKYIRLNDQVTKHKALTHEWIPTHAFPTGRLCLQAYSPYRYEEWIKQWRQSKENNLADSIPIIVRELEKVVVKLSQIVEEGRRKDELEYQRFEEMTARWKRETEEKRLSKARNDSKDELLQIIKAWVEAKNLDEFIFEIEQILKKSPEDDRKKLLDRIIRARELMGNTNALDRFLTWKSPEER